MSGNLTHPPSMVLRALLVELVAVSLPASASTWPCFISHMPSDASGSPVNAVAVFDRQGEKQGRSMVDGAIFEASAVQVLVRCSSYHDGYTQAQAIAVACDDARKIGIETGQCFFSFTGISRGSVVPLGTEDEGRNYLFSLNVAFSLTETPLTEAGSLMAELADIYTVDEATYFAGA